MKIANLILMMVYCLASETQAQEDWVHIAESKSSVWAVKPGSLEVTRTRGDVPIAVVVGRITDKTEKTITIYKWYVPLGDCKRELWKVIATNVDGSFAFENAFAFGSGNVASAMAEAICEAHSQYLSIREKKSL